MHNYLYFFFLLFSNFSLLSQNAIDIKIPFEQEENYSAAYEEGIQVYQELSEISDLISINEFGMTDIGKPLHYVTVSGTMSANDPEDKLIIFINNAIHPGEPCGVDASMLLVRDLISDPAQMERLKNITLVIIPYYNVGGALNRNAYSRANQNGPRLYGFRGNAKNLDLNRDFIKTDSKNAQSFNKLYNKWNPHIFIDNHTSNGADYQYTLTLIATQKDKLSGPLSDLMVNDMLPYLYNEMADKKWEMTPYVNVRGTPDNGIYGFNETARYSTGYSSLHHAIGFMPETHMLKPFDDRVMSVYHFMQTLIDYASQNSEKIKLAKMKSIAEYAAKDSVDIEWVIDMDKKEKLMFKGYEAKYKPSEISSKDRLYYDREAPYTKEIDFYNTYRSAITISKPKAYSIPQSYTEVIKRLQWNDVHMLKIEKDTSVLTETYYITDYESTEVPYESHYLHYNIKVDKRLVKSTLKKGDFLIPLGQEKDRYIVETLEPHAPDSFFAWNYFDGILMQKEYFSSYVFEDLAAHILNDNPQIKKSLDEKKANDPEFAEDSRAQLDYIYKLSKHYESTHRKYPVLRLLN